MAPLPPDRHLLRAKDLIDARYAEPLDVDALARAARASTAHFARSFRRAFGETPHQYLLTRRMERAAALLRTTDHPVLRICLEVGLTSAGSFTSSFRRTFGVTPTAHRPRPDPHLRAHGVARPLGRAALEKTAHRRATSLDPVH